MPTSDQFNFPSLKNIRPGLLEKGKNIEYNWIDCAFICVHGVLKPTLQEIVQISMPYKSRKLLDIQPNKKFGKYWVK